MPYSASFTHYHLPRMQEMGRIFWCHSIGMLAISLAMIFVPIFLLNTGFSFTEVLLYILLQQLLAVLLQYPVSKSFQFIHPHYLLAFGAICYVLFFGILSTIEAYHWSLLLLAFLWALNRTIYWTAFHYIFGLARKPLKAGRQIAGINALTMLASTVAPAIGGLVAQYFGIEYIYITASILLIISVVPIIGRKNIIPKSRLTMTWKEAWAIRRDAIANLCNGVVLAGEFNIWALLVFVLVGTYAGVGLLSSVIALASIIITIYVGRREETRGEKRYIKEGLAFYSITSLGRAIAQNSLHVFGLNLLGGIGRSLYTTPYMNRYYSNSDKGSRLGYISIMESMFSVGGVIYISVLLALSLVLPMKDVLTIGMGIVAIGVIGIRVMR
jgi:hypothetical protein